MPRQLIPTIGNDKLTAQATAIGQLSGAGASIYAAAKIAGMSEEDAQMLNQGDVPSGITQ